jgi:probable HAF family extracellular repeat protein
MKQHTESIMSITTGKTFKLAIAAAALLTPILAGSNLPHMISRSARGGKPAAATPASSQYRFVTIDAPGASGTGPTGVNNTGQVSGWYFDFYFGAAGNTHGFLWQNGGLQTVDYPGASVTLLGPVTDSGLIMGEYGTETSQHAATYNTRLATWTNLPDIPGYPMNFGQGINNSGVGTGEACTGNLAVSLNCVGWTWDRGAYSFFTDPEGDPAQGGTSPEAINNAGQVVGYFLDASGVPHGFLKNGDSFTTIDPPAASFTLAYSINDRGDIVGFYGDTTGTPHGFVRGSDGQFTTFDVPGAFATFLGGTDDRRDLAGSYRDQAGNLHGFVAFKK